MHKYSPTPFRRSLTHAFDTFINYYYLRPMKFKHAHFVLTDPSERIGVIPDGDTRQLDPSVERDFSLRKALLEFLVESMCLIRQRYRWMNQVFPSEFSTNVFRFFYLHFMKWARMKKILCVKEIVSIVFERIITVLFNAVCFN